jgi:hypothetical protein
MEKAKPESSAFSGNSIFNFPTNVVKFLPRFPLRWPPEVPQPKADAG